MSILKEITEEQLPAELVEHWDNAKASIEKNNPGYAVKFLQAILKMEPGFLNARKLLRQAEIDVTNATPKTGKKVASGSSYLRQAKKDPAAGIIAAEKDLEKDPFNTGANDALHEISRDNNLPDTAAFALETSRKGNPEATKIAHKLAEYYITREMFAEASDVYRDIVAQDPTDSTAIKAEKDCSAKASMQKNRISEDASFRDLVKSDEAAELEKASRSALTRDQLKERAAQLSAQYAQDQNDINIVKQLAETYEQLEDWNTSYQFYSWASQLTPSDIALKSKADQIRDKAADQYVKDVESAAEANPEDADLQAKMEEIRRNRLEERLSECQQRVDQNPTDPKLRYELGLAHYDSGQFSEAIPHLQQATRNPHIRTKVLLLLGRTFDAKGMTDLSIKQLQDANQDLMQMDATKKEVLYELGVILEKAGRTEESLDSFKQIYEVDYGYRDVAARVEGSYTA